MFPEPAIPNKATTRTSASWTRVPMAGDLDEAVNSEVLVPQVVHLRFQEKCYPPSKRAAQSPRNCCTNSQSVLVRFNMFYPIQIPDTEAKTSKASPAHIGDVQKDNIRILDNTPSSTKR